MMSKKDFSRRALLLSLVLAIPVAVEARGRRGGRGWGGSGDGGTLALGIFVGLGALIGASHVIGRLSERLYRRKRAAEGFPIPARKDWDRLGRCPLCGEIMQLAPVRARKRGKPSPFDHYRCIRGSKCIGGRQIPHRLDLP